MAVVDEAKLGYLDFLSREDRVRHHRYVEEMKQYDMMRSGDINAISESTRLWDSGLYGYLSDDPLKNAKYRFVTTITLATRFAIEGGMDEEPTTLPTCIFRISTTARRPTTFGVCIPT